MYPNGRIFGTPVGSMEIPNAYMHQPGFQEDMDASMMMLAGSQENQLYFGVGTASQPHFLGAQTIHKYSDVPLPLASSDTLRAYDRFLGLDVGSNTSRRGSILLESGKAIDDTAMDLGSPEIPIPTAVHVPNMGTYNSGVVANKMPIVPIIPDSIPAAKRSQLVVHHSTQMPRGTSKSSTVDSFDMNMSSSGVGSKSSSYKDTYGLLDAELDMHLTDKLHR